MHGTSPASTWVPLSGLGGLVTLADQTALPEGASPRTHDTDYIVGLAKTRAGLTNVYNVVSSTVGPNAPLAAASSTWVNPNNILLNDGAFATQTPVNVANALTITDFNFNIPITDQIAGALLTLYGYANAACNIVAQLIVGGVPVGTPKTIAVPVGVSASFVLGSTSDQWGTILLTAAVNGLSFGVQISAATTGFDLATIFLDYATLTIGVSTGGQNFQTIEPFVDQQGNVKNLSLDAAGNFYVEDVTNSPGTRSLLFTGITPGSYFIGINGSGVEYMAFTDGVKGSDMPLQYTPQWVDRITQVGPGAAPSFAPGAASSNTFPITSITQPPANSDATNPGHISVLLWSAGPGSTAPGNVLTVYYSPSFVGGSPAPGNQDMTLVNEFNSGNATYVYISGTPFGSGTYLVTSVGNALPPHVDHFRYYFTVQMPTSNFQEAIAAAGQYQQTLATLTTANPVPGLAVGNNVTVAGASVPAWDNTWPITQELNSAAMSITQTSVALSVATYSYAVNQGTPPAAGQLVTVTGTTNANGALNVTNATIVSSTGGTTGTFTVNVAVVSAASAPETGLATTAGTIFTIDPGPGDVGTASNPILGNSTGGTLTYVGAAAQIVGPGTRQGTVFFITRNGYYTAPAPPVTFTCPLNTLNIQASNIPIGPPNVIARGIAFTEAGQNGVPGANFFTIPTPVSYIVNNQTYTATALIINDNTTTSATFQFTDSVLLNALAIDVYGYNLFNQIEIGDPAWVGSFDSRNVYGKCLNKIQNFNNLSFDGGYLPSLQSGQLVPLGWTTPDIYGQLVVSQKFGNAYYIQNTSAGTLTVAGLISQTAYQDAYQQPIINPNTLYSVRVTASNPSGLKTGNLVVTLTAGGVTYGTFTLPFSSLTTSQAIYSSTLVTAKMPTVPPGLTLNVYASVIGVNADVEIDRIDIYPTNIPVLSTTEFWSYAGLPEQVDAVTGKVVYESENQMPVNGSITLYDTHYAVKGWTGNAPGSSLYSLQASANLEPAQWEEPEVSQRSGGAIGPLSFDGGEQWFLAAARAGLYLFVGGQPGKIMQEIYQVWDAINWKYGYTIWVKVDITHRKIYVGVPLPTPNFWLPNAPVNANPTSPNVILMCNYQGLDSGEMLRSEPQMHTTMFGSLNAIDMRRKWSIWQIPAPSANIVQSAGISGEQADEALYICNGRGTSQIYKLDETAQTDNGIFIDSRYTTAGLVELSKRAQFQQLGFGRIRWDYLLASLVSQGNVGLTLYPNRLEWPIPTTGHPPAPVQYNSWTYPGGISPGFGQDDAEAALNFAATRTFVEFRETDGFGFQLSNLALHGRADTWNKLRGRVGVTP